MTTVSDFSITLRELVLMLVVDLAEDKNFKSCFKAAHQDLHQFFWELSQNNQECGFVADLLFDRNGNYPYSDQIDEILQEFQLSGVLSRPNPTYRYNDIDIDRSSLGEPIRDRFSSEQREVYQGILTRFKKRLGVPED